MRRLLLAVVLVLALVLSGCGSESTPAPVEPPAPAAPSAAAEPTAAPSQPDPASRQAEPTAAPSQPTATVPQPTAQPTESTAAPVATEEADLVLADRESALSQLRSYVATWSLTWTGKQDGEDQTVAWKATQRYTADPEASHMIIESTDSLDAEASGVFEIIQIGTQSYMITDEGGEQQCISFSSDDNRFSQNWIGPDAFGSVRGGRYVGQETVNGIRTKHYRYDEKATGIDMYSRLSGDIWVAVDGGYAVKDVAEWEGNLLGAVDETAEEGKGSWTWELSEVNQPLEIAAPPDCESAAAGLPVLPDATEKASFGDMTTYTTATKLADVVAFYETEMPKAGWTPAEGGMRMDELASLAFTKGEQKATVMVSVDGEQVSVMINVGK